MKRIRESKYFTLSISLFLTGAALLLLQNILENFEGFTEAMVTAKRIVSPFIYGLVMAYLLCPVYNLVVRKTYHALSAKVSNKRRCFVFARVLGTIVALAVLFGIVAGLFALLIPELVNSIVGIATDLPSKMEQLTEWVDKITVGLTNREIAEILRNLTLKGQDTLLTWVQNEFLPGLGTYMNMISEGIILTLKTVLNVFIGVIVCAYFLNNKEVFKAQSRKIIFALFRKEKADEIFNFAVFTNNTFGGFINGKIIDSAIIGVICFGAMSILQLPYPILISTIIGVTNIIPFFGPFIGAIPAATIIFLVSPVQAVYFLIMILILQQLDGNVIGPAILGETTGLASFWVMFAILVGGGLFGFAGMILGVPVFAVIYYYFGRFIRKKLRMRNLPEDTFDYKEYNRYDIDRREIDNGNN